MHEPKKPVADAVWVGRLVPHLNYRNETYHRTRFSGITYITNVLLDHFKSGRRVLVGFDFPYGHPEGFARALSFCMLKSGRVW